MTARASQAESCRPTTQQAVLGVQPRYYTSLRDPATHDYSHPEDALVLRAKLTAWVTHSLPLPHVFPLRESRADGAWVSFRCNGCNGCNARG